MLVLTQKKILFKYIIFYKEEYKELLRFKNLHLVGFM